MSSSSSRPSSCWSAGSLLFESLITTISARTLCPHGGQRHTSPQDKMCPVHIKLLSSELMTGEHLHCPPMWTQSFDTICYLFVSLLPGPLKRSFKRRSALMLNSCQRRHTHANWIQMYSEGELKHTEWVTVRPHPHWSSPRGGAGWEYELLTQNTVEAQLRYPAACIMRSGGPTELIFPAYARASGKKIK